MKRYAVLLLMLFLLLSAISLMAQEATPEATPDPTSEATVQVSAPQTMTELFASLPQSRTTDGGFVVGQPTAPITVIEYIDYACPHCQAYRPVVDQMLMQYLPAGQMQYELRLFPTAGGQLSYDVDLLVECADEQHAGAFWQAYDLLYGYATSGKYDQNVAKRMATALDVNYTKMIACAQTAKQVDNDITLGEQLGVTGTPAVMVSYGDGDPMFITLGGTTYSKGGVPFDVLSAVIDQANGIETTPEAPSQILMNLAALGQF